MKQAKGDTVFTLDEPGDICNKSMLFPYVMVFFFFFFILLFFIMKRLISSGAELEKQLSEILPNRWKTKHFIKT